MKIQYYNSKEFYKIVRIMNINPTEAKIRFEEYIKSYPMDYSAYLYYAETYICLGEFSKAEKIINYIENKVNNDKNFTFEKEKIIIFNNHKLYAKLKLLSYQNKYQELYSLCINNKKIINKLKLNHVLFWARKQIGKINPYKRDTNQYLFRQIVKYKESDFLKQINKHKADNYEENFNIQGIFNSDFPLEKVLEETKKYIPSKNCIYPGLFEDVYTFKYNECGRENNKLVNYFKVICLHNTDNILIMHPTQTGKYINYIDLNYLNKKEEPIIKRKSQIDKFNQKYNRK